jgi:hypothetical protein
MLDGAGQVYYTTDGSDPRGANGNPGATAISYNAVQDFLTTTSPGKYLVATGAGSESGWQGRLYNDVAWPNAAGSVGFDTGAGETIGGFAVRIVDTTAGFPGATGNFTAFAGAAIHGNTIAFVGLGTSGKVGLLTWKNGVLATLATHLTVAPGGGLFTGFGNLSFHGPTVAFEGLVGGA